MEQFVKHFVREAPGEWSCLEPATLDLLTGRVQVTPGSRFVRGTTFMGIDLAELLEEQYQKDEKRR